MDEAVVAAPDATEGVGELKEKDLDDKEQKEQRHSRFHQDLQALLQGRFSSCGPGFSISGVRSEITHLNHSFVAHSWSMVSSGGQGAPGQCTALQRSSVLIMSIEMTGKALAP